MEVGQVAARSPRAGLMPRGRQDAGAPPVAFLCHEIQHCKPAFCPCQGMSTSLPVVARLSSWRCASAACASGKVPPIRKVSLPDVAQFKTSFARASRSVASDDVMTEADARHS